MLELIRRRLGNQEGQGLVEYTLTVSLIAVVSTGRVFRNPRTASQAESNLGE